MPSGLATPPAQRAGCCTQRPQILHKQRLSGLLIQRQITLERHQRVGAVRLYGSIGQRRLDRHKARLQHLFRLQLQGRIGHGRKHPAPEAVIRLFEEEAAMLAQRLGTIGGIGGWAMNMRTMEIRWTDQTCRIHDLPPGHVPTLDESIAFYLPDARVQIEEAIDQAITCGQPFDLELPMLTASGRFAWVRVVGELELLDGVPHKLVGAVQDVTARKRAEIALPIDFKAAALEVTPEQLRDSYKLGCKFAVSPGSTGRLLGAAEDYDIALLPGGACREFAGDDLRQLHLLQHL